MTVLHYLENTLKKTADKTALYDINGSLSFFELHEVSRKIAGYLCKRLGDSRHNPILVYLPKSKECISCFFGIAYSGNFYTPTDVSFPFDKVKSLIDHLNPKLIITDRKNAKKLEDNGISADKIVLYDEMICLGYSIDTEKYIARIIDTDPLYVLYTSGSTGVPKGVVICHRSVRDYIDFLINKFNFDDTMKIASQAPFYFDNSVLDIYTCVATGSTLYIPPETYFAFPARLMQYITQNHINFIFWVPSALILVANSGILEDIDCSCLKKIFFAGEVMPNKQLNCWRKKLPDALYVNLYGPTEITVDCTYYIVEREFADDEPLPIGFPCDNSDIILLDEENMPVLDHETVGELCVRGTSLSLGYWKDPQKTAEVFVQNPLNANFEEKIYYTGDLAHYNTRGELMFDGRKDAQIKHMGNRIEPGEIEFAAIGVDGVFSACADYDATAKKIILFYTGICGEMELRKSLTEKLPRYMIPGIYRRLDSMPLNSNGKIDRQVLKGRG